MISSKLWSRKEMTRHIIQVVSKDTGLKRKNYQVPEDTWTTKIIGKVTASGFINRFVLSRKSKSLTIDKAIALLFSKSPHLYTVGVKLLACLRIYYLQEHDPSIKVFSDSLYNVMGKICPLVVESNLYDDAFFYNTFLRTQEAFNER